MQLFSNCIKYVLNMCEYLTSIVLFAYTFFAGRSYPTHRQFTESSPEAKEGRASLFRVLAMYARYNKKVGYCQGTNVF